MVRDVRSCGFFRGRPNMLGQVGVHYAWFPVGRAFEAGT